MFEAGHGMKEALFYEKLDNNKVRCLLCPHECVLAQDGTGVCRARRNTDGRLYSLNYSLVTSVALDPIEKKPLYHFRPGSLILSAGTFGCNFKCSWCQNWTIAHTDARTMELTPAGLAELAGQYASRGSIGVAYTYNEPSIWYEFVYDSAKLVREMGLVNVLVTNGFINPEPLEQLLPYIDAMNIDVKAFTEEFYRKYCKGSLRSVMDTVERAARSCHVEITTLVIPGLNDSPEEIDRLASWLASISPDIVLHLSRFFPNYQMNDMMPTPRQTLEDARNSALKHIRHVCLGNI
jgi:pyruvate formate lyase activating enzyme